VDDYFVAPRPAARATPQVPGFGPEPAASPRQSPISGHVAVILLIIGVILSALAIFVQIPLLLAPVADIPSVHQMVTLAPSSTGWGPEFVDSLGRPARINPCVPMEYAVNLDRAPVGALEVVKGAVASLTAASGLRFTFTGLTNDRPGSPGAPALSSSRRRVLIGWTAPGEQLGGATRVGLTRPRAVSTPNGPVIVGADILISSERVFAEAGAVSHESMRLVLLHELGHAVGLRHVDESSQVMSPVAEPWLTEYGNGDRIGLRTLGSGGCLPSTR
jgi:hypothetical protein